MKAAHREAARLLYQERNNPHNQPHNDNNNFSSDASSRQLFVDLHGLHPDEAVAELAAVLAEHARSRPPRYVYAITGTGHHSRGGRDKVGKGVRVWLAERRYAFREFSVPGDRANVGGILGIDPTSGEGMEVAGGGGGGEEGGLVEKGIGEGSTKVRILKREDVEAERRVRDLGLEVGDDG